METFKELFSETLKDIYYAEKAILKALPKMVNQASSKKLQTAFAKHEKETAGTGQAPRSGVRAVGRARVRQEVSRG
jgi:ferritin-like metal-binding protein YciE